MPIDNYGQYFSDDLPVTIIRDDAGRPTSEIVTDGIFNYTRTYTYSAGGQLDISNWRRSVVNRGALPVVDVPGTPIMSKRFSSGRELIYGKNSRLCNRGTPLWEGSPDASLFTITGQSAASVTVSETSDGGLRVACATADRYIDILMALPYETLVKSAVLDGKASTTQNIVSAYFGTNSGLSPVISKSWTVAGSAVTHRTGARQLLWCSNTVSSAWSNSSSLDLDTYLFNYMRIRISPSSGQTADFTLYGMKINPSGRSRIAVVSDDGYLGWIKYAAPLLARRGIPSSLAIIPNLIDVNASYATLPMLKRFVAHGNECIPHGPAVGSTLYDVYTDDTQRINDILNTRSWLQANGLSGEQQLKCYIYPGGVFQGSAGDTGLMDFMYANGITLGRTVTRFIGFSGDELTIDVSNTKYSALTVPIIGYIRQSTEANDTTELTNTTNSIQYCAQNGLDGVVMLHNVIAAQETWTWTQSTDITIDKLVTIADKLVEARDTYGAEIVLFSEFAP